MRIATYPHLGEITSRNMRLQSNFAEKTSQLSSGLKSQTWGGIANDAELSLNLQRDIARQESYTGNLNKAATETDVMYRQLNDMLLLLDRAMANLSSAISGDQTSAQDLEVLVQVVYDEFVGGMNSQYAGLYLFGGDNTTNPPVDLADADYDTPFMLGDAADFDYYQGNDAIHSVRASDGYEISYGVLASDPAFEQALRGMDMLLNAPDNDDVRDEAFDLLIGASDGIAVLYNQTSIAATAINEQIEFHQTNITQLQNAQTSLISTDIAVVSTQVATIETQLQAAYSATSKVLGLNILDFLR